LVIGPDEQAAGTVGIKNLKSNSDQVTVPCEKVVEEVKERLAQASGGPEVSDD
jgi:hypothetical protein